MSGLRAALALPALLLALAACAPGPGTGVPGRAVPALDPLPPMRHFAERPPRRVTRPNRALARDFLDLAFRMESGQPLEVMSRFEGPVTLRVTGENIPPTLEKDLRRLLTRLRREARIDIARVPASRPAGITIEAVPQSRLQRLVPQAACFVAPRVTNWREFRRRRRSRVTDWTTLERREHVAIFLPADASPQEVRDCLHEEVAQALGPLNDLYRLADSVFNDDNFHTVLTGFDMTMLRIYYAPELHSGMSRAEAGAALPGILRRINPGGEGLHAGPVRRTPRAWNAAVTDALSPRTGDSRRAAAAREALRIARAQRWNDNRTAFALFINARLVADDDLEQAIRNFLEARAIYAARPETGIHAAHMTAHLAIFALSAGQPEEALKLIDPALAPVEEAENAALLSTLLMTRSEALRALGREEEARRALRRSLGWARYGFGSEREVRKRLAEIAALRPRPERRAEPGGETTDTSIGG